MRVNKISFKNYRNLKNSQFTPGEGVNIIYGDNAQGKTNLIELMWLFTGGRSFRGAKDSELIKFCEKESEIEMDFYAQKREQNIKIKFNDLGKEIKKEIYLNDVYKKSNYMIIGSFCAVVFSPVHLALVKEGPSLRRKFIDAAICQAEPAYASVLARYKRAVSQRNTLIKDSVSFKVSLDDMIDVWDNEIAKRGKIIIKKREEYCTELQKNVSNTYKELANNNEYVDIKYELSFEKGNDVEKSFLKKLRERRESDKKNGYTSVGPHRDDIDISINGVSAKKYASQGQQRFIVLSLKLAEAKILEKAIGEKPVIFFDDVLSELDKKRQGYLINKIKDFQVFITCCELNNLIKESNANLFDIYEFSPLFF